jgi:drug/metabolite transporter (DMT)-like permease
MGKRMTKTLFLFGFLLLVVLDTICQVGFKFTADRTAPATWDLAWLHRMVAEPWLHFVIVGYLFAFATYMTILRSAPVGPVFAATHLEVATVPIVSVLFLGEHLNIVQTIGCLLILLGVGVLWRAEQTAVDQGAKPRK